MTETPIRAIIIDDEKIPRENLKDMITRFCKGITIVAEADGVDTGYAAIAKYQPQIVFLDVQMPPYDGFHLLSMFGTLPFEVVFTTAFDQYALQAFKVSALDYLLKPVTVSDLRTVVEKFEKKAGVNGYTHPGENKIVVTTKDSFLFIEPAHVVRLETEPGHKTKIILNNGRQPMIVTKELGHYETILKNHTFFRTHRSHIVNLNQIIEYVPDKTGGCVVMQDGAMVPVSANLKDAFLERLNGGK